MKLTPATLDHASTRLREDRAYMGLTPRQWAFAEARARGRSVTEAYIEAYKPPETMSKNAIMAGASETEANLKVQARIRARLLELQGDNSALPVIGRDFVITGIAALAIAGEKETTRLKGYELLGKALGLFDRGPEQIEKPKTVNDVDAKLRELLRATMANPAPVIDAEILPDAPTGEAQAPTDE